MYILHITMTLNILSFLFFSISVLSPLFYFNVYVLFFAKEHSMFLLSNSASFHPNVFSQYLQLHCFRRHSKYALETQMLRGGNNIIG